jgi:hypothetical protein
MWLAWAAPSGSLLLTRIKLALRSPESGIIIFGIATVIFAREKKAMLSYLMVFSVGALLGSLVMGLYVAFVGFKDARGDW